MAPEINRDLEFSGMKDGIEDGSNDHGTTEDGRPIGDHGKPILDFGASMGDGEHQGLSPKEESLEKFSEAEIEEVNSLIREFRDDENFCDLSMLEDRGLGDHPEMIQAFRDHLSRISEYKELYDATDPLTETHVRRNHRRAVQDLLLRAMEEGKSRVIARRGPITYG